MSRGARSAGGAAPAAAASDEQRMFQDFRKQSCTAYTGVVVHCQNMKLEARVNMVSYVPERERKISGGQIYIAYMTNPHQAAVVHDITASIMTAEGIPIYHNNNLKPSVNHEVAIERLNYLDTLEPNLQRCAPCCSSAASCSAIGLKTTPHPLWGRGAAMIRALWLVPRFVNSFHPNPFGLLSAFSLHASWMSLGECQRFPHSCTELK